MKIAIIGYGFVGQALAYGLNNDVEFFAVDPKNNTCIKDLENFRPDVIFICVPTPMSDDGSQDISIVKKVIKEVRELTFSVSIVLKSTILPNHIKEIEGILPQVVYNPEFLREKHANEDFINGNLIVFGGAQKETKYISEIYRNHTKCINNEYVFTDLISASLIKFSINSFLSTKVIFFNQLFNVFNKSGTNESWKNFINALSKDKRIGSSHMQVPGHDGRFGFGGACLPKDSNAFFNYSLTLDAPLGLLFEAIKSNNKIRGDYESNTSRELDQNIKFSKD
tara:strand:- start:97 stop:939 length:843 start_codon:yes stop_codon:yes gene_type:complete